VLIEISPNKKGTVEYYSKKSIAEGYDEERWASPQGRLLDRTQREEVLKLSGPVSGKSILEVGTGSGRFSIGYAKNTGRVVAVDSSESMLKVARNRALRDGLGIHFLRADADNLPFKDGFFDIVLCVHVLNHIPDYQRTLSEISRMTKKKGKVIVSVPNLLSYYFLVATIYVPLRNFLGRSSYYSHYFTYMELKKAFEKAGLRVTEVVGLFPISVRVVPTFLMGVYESIVRKTLRSPFRYLGGIYIIKGEK
jgi:ubiquinone biosynthesis O-methyltransferase